MKAQKNDKIRIVNKMSDWCMDYEEGDVFTVESTWYGGVNVTGKTGVPISLDEVEYEVIGREDKQGLQKENRKVLIHADRLSGLEQAVSDASELLASCKEKGMQAEIEILANGEAVKGFESESADAQTIRELYGQGVKFFACEKALGSLGIGKETLMSGVKTVVSGAVELVEKQIQGFAYIKA